MQGSKASAGPSPGAGEWSWRAGVAAQLRDAVADDGDRLAVLQRQRVIGRVPEHGANGDELVVAAVRVRRPKVRGDAGRCPGDGAAAPNRIRSQDRPVLD